MKIQKGILVKPVETATPPAPPQRPGAAAAATPIQVEKDRLFETLEKEKSGNRNYARLFLIAVAAVLVAGGVIFYLTLPKPGETVRAPKGAELAVRSHLQDKQKREAEDITFYYCGENSYWARAGVKTRSDMPNPVFKISTYAATIKGSDPNWEITSKPIASRDDDKPCT